MIKTAVLFALMFASGIVTAQTISMDDYKTVVRNLGMTNYWTKGPASLLWYCSKTYPETQADGQKKYLAWKATNAAYDRRLEVASDQAAPFIVQMTGKSMEDFQLNFTKMVDKQVVGPFMGLDEGKRSLLCKDFSSVLSTMFADDLIKPRVTIAVEEIEQVIKAQKK